MSPARAIVIGGGIGGLTAAIEVRAAGLDVEVYERRDELAEVNTGFLLWGFAVRRLRALGLGDALSEIGHPMTRLLTKSAGGRTLSELDLSPLDARFGSSSFDVHRAELQRALADRLGREQIRLGRRCTSVDADGGRARFEDDGQTAGDLVIGADGASSTVRASIVGEVGLRRNEFGVWRGIAEVDSGVLPEGVHLRMMGPAAVFGAGRLGGRVVRWYAGTVAPVSPAPAGEARKRQVLDHFGSWAEPVCALIERTEASTVLFNDTPNARPLSRWHRGVVGLLGDAAHPTVPTLAMGGGMAIEDAGVLGEELRRHGATAAALAAMESRRRPHAARVQRRSVAFGRVLALRRPMSVRVREGLFGARFEPLQLRVIARLMRGA